MKFLHFVGNSWLNGKAVAAYRAGDKIKLRAETTGNKHLPGTRIAELTDGEYEALRSEWSADCLDMRDARIQQRALAYLGCVIE